MISQPGRSVSVITCLSLSWAHSLARPFICLHNIVLCPVVPPNASGDVSSTPLSKHTSEMGKKSFEIIESYQTGGRTTLCKESTARIYNTKFTRPLNIASPITPQFLSTESMVDLAHILSGGFTASIDNRDIKSVGGIQFKSGTAWPAECAENSRNHFSQRTYLKGDAFTFPYWFSEIDYSQQTLGLFCWPEALECEYQHVCKECEGKCQANEHRGPKNRSA